VAVEGEDLPGKVRIRSKKAASSILLIFKSFALLTLLAPGSLPTTRYDVFLLTADVTRLSMCVNHLRRFNPLSCT
jgi:hypothetical protein